MSALAQAFAKDKGMQYADFDMSWTLIEVGRAAVTGSKGGGGGAVPQSTRQSMSTNKMNSAYKPDTPSAMRHV